jgi:hypothetical protein
MLPGPRWRCSRSSVLDSHRKLADRFQQLLFFVLEMRGQGVANVLDSCYRRRPMPG